MYFSKRSDFHFWLTKISPILTVSYYLILFASFFLIGILLVALNIPVLPLLVLFGCLFLFENYLAHGPKAAKRWLINYAETAMPLADGACKVFRQPELPSSRVFICRSSFDEASMWLRSIGTVLDTARWTYTIASSVFYFPKFGMATAAFALIVMWLLERGREGLYFVFWYYSLALILTLGSAIFVKYFSRVLANQPFSYGPDRFVDNAITEVSVRRYPNIVGGLPMEHLSVSRLPIRFLNHCNYYLDRETIGAIATWINNRLPRTP